MRFFFFIISSLFFCSNALAQIDFKDDPESIINKYTDYVDLNNRADKNLYLDNDFDFEFRLWTDENWGYKSLFLLRKKNNVWKANFIKYDGQKDIWSKQKVKQKNLDGLWNYLLRNQILTLPTQDSVRYKMKLFEADTVMIFFEEDTYKKIQIVDGTGYRFELRTKEKKRAYEYHCPKSYLEHYPGVEELYRAYAIIILVRRQLGLSYDIC